MAFEPSNLAKTTLHIYECLAELRPSIKKMLCCPPADRFKLIKAVNEFLERF